MRSRRTYTALIIAAELVAGLLAIATNIAADQLPAEWRPYLWTSWLVTGVLVLVGLLIAIWLKRLEFASDSAGIRIGKKRNQRSRRRMLQQVKAIWVEGLLNRSLDRIARIDLGLESRPAAVSHTWDVLVQRYDRRPEPLPTGTSATRVFDEVGGTLLILGAPGAGKNDHAAGASQRPDRPRHAGLFPAYTGCIPSLPPGPSSDSH
jgi:hypothetical protein